MIVPWSEVREHWKNAEEELWRPYYTERGFTTWEAWRITYCAALRLPERAWSLVPAEDIVHWFIGGFQGWKKYWPEGQSFTTFGEVARSPILLENPKIKELVDGLHEATFICLRCGDEVIVIDGTHRASAYAYRALRGMPLPKCQVYIADIPQDERALFDAFRGDLPMITKK